MRSTTTTAAAAAASTTTATTKSTPTNENNNVRGASQVSHMQRKTMLRRLNGENKYASSDSTTTMKPPPPLSSLPIGRAMSAEAKINGAERPLNVTETISSSNGADIQSDTIVVSSTNDRCLTRSGTFVCEASDETQTKLLSLTHNINSPTPTAMATPPAIVNDVTQTIAQKERTFKRSLSPIYGELMSMAKRKSMQMPNQTGVVTSIGPSLISTPHGSSQVSIPSFNTARNTLSNITELDNTMMFMDQSHVMSSTAVQSTRLIDVKRPSSHANDENSGKIARNLTKLLYVTEAGATAVAVDGVECDNYDTLVGAEAEEDAIADEEIVLVETTRTHSGK